MGLFTRWHLARESARLLVSYFLKGIAYFISSRASRTFLSCRPTQSDAFAQFALLSTSCSKRMS